MTVTAAGMRFTVEESSSLQAKSFLREDVFHQFSCREKNVQFQVNISAVLDCLSIFGASLNTALQMCYPPSGDKLILMYVKTAHVSLSNRLEEGGVLTDCAINTFDPEDAVRFNFRQSLSNRTVIDVRRFHGCMSYILC